MTREARRVARRVRKHVVAGRARFTNKARLEIATLRIKLLDAVEILAALSADDFDTTFKSSVTGEPLYLFRFMVPGVSLYIKLALRDACIVISFHEERDDEEGRIDD